MMIQKQAPIEREVMEPPRKVGFGWKPRSKRKLRMSRKSTCSMRCARSEGMKAMGCGESSRRVEPVFHLDPYTVNQPNGHSSIGLIITWQLSVFPKADGLLFSLDPDRAD